MTAAVMLAAGCQPKIEQLISVSPASLEFDGNAGTQTVTVNSSETWALKVIADGTWCKTSKTYGKGSTTVEVSVGANGPQVRTAEIIFNASGSAPVSVKVTQKEGNAVVTDPVSPSSESGITVDPALPNADEPATIKFNPTPDNPLYEPEGDLYAHLGVIVEYRWKFVPNEWDAVTDKVKFTKVGDHSWELKLEPSIREFFQSGETPVCELGLIVRSADGETKSHEADQFCSVIDNKYQPEKFDPDPVVTENMPSGLEHGINYNSDGSVSFVLYDQNTVKQRYEYCYIVGDWNEWTRVSEGAMKWDPSAGCWWITLSGFDPDTEYRFQYRLGRKSGSNIYLSDPYTEIVYDESNDQYIDWAPEFPEKGYGLVSAFQINKPSYSWQIEDYRIEDKNDLVIYEMLFRDFTATQNIAGALAELDYIENLGVNAIELMPIQEFDGNLSWGYDPNHWFALDKYYGKREDYKKFIDECHKRGMAVIVDVVYNHATGAHPWAKMYWDSAKNCTSALNPWFNVVAKHPYNVFHDMNHENEMVVETVKKSLTYLLEEYKIDGFRFDLTKGFTQNNTGANDSGVGAWSKYDQSRINILKDYADHIWSVDDNAVVIFEHLSDWDEEKVLADHGIQLWRNVNYDYRNAVNGGTGDFANMYSTAPFGGFVGYMESHDEERLCTGGEVSSVEWGIIGLSNKWGEEDDIVMEEDGIFVVAKNVTVTATDQFKIRKAYDKEWTGAYNYGAYSDGDKLTLNGEYIAKNGKDSKNFGFPAAGTYDIYFCPEIATIWLMEPGKRPSDPVIPNDENSPKNIALRRAGASAAFFLTVPGPKMIWQFGEIGYDYSIEYNGRTGQKPVVTDQYMSDPYRKALYDTYAKLLKFRRDNPRFFDKDATFNWTPTGNLKNITCSVGGQTFHVVGNFAQTQQSYTLPSGTWNDYMNGGQVFGTINLKQGEFRLLTNF